MPITTTSLADLVIADPRRTRILESLGLDYCCNGQQSLAEAAASAGLDADEVAAALTLADPAPASNPATATEQPGTALAHDIMDTHHAYMWEEMPRLEALVAKVHAVHGDRHAELAQVKETFEAALEALDPHMTREERSVFPMIVRMEKGQPAPQATQLPQTVSELVSEHQVVGDLFKRIHALTNGYQVPQDACGSYRAMLNGLQEMEFDLHEHIHKENNILFPQALRLAEASLAPEDA